MDAIENMLTRRSCRRFRPELPPRACIEEIVRIGTYAPSGMNRQSPIIVAVTDPDIRRRLSEMNAAVMGREGQDPFYGAPVILNVLAKRSCPTYLYDGSLVMGQLMLAAHSMGLGSCWIHRAKEVFSGEEGQQLLKSLGIEGDYEGIGHCILGYPEDMATSEAALRKDHRIYFA